MGNSQRGCVPNSLKACLSFSFSLPFFFFPFFFSHVFLQLPRYRLHHRVTSFQSLPLKPLRLFSPHLLFFILIALDYVRHCCRTAAAQCQFLPRTLSKYLSFHKPFLSSITQWDSLSCDCEHAWLSFQNTTAYFFTSYLPLIKSFTLLQFVSKR